MIHPSRPSRRPPLGSPLGRGSGRILIKPSRSFSIGRQSAQRRRKKDQHRSRLGRLSTEECGSSGSRATPPPLPHAEARETERRERYFPWHGHETKGHDVRDEEMKSAEGRFVQARCKLSCGWHQIIVTGRERCFRWRLGVLLLTCTCRLLGCALHRPFSLTHQDARFVAKAAV